MEALPPTVTALKQMEQQTTSPVAQTPPPAAPVGPSLPWYKKLFGKFKVQPIWVKAIVVGLTLVFCLGSTMAVMTLTALDTKIFQLTLDGVVLDEKGSPVANAIVALDTAIGRTDTSGKFFFGNLEIKKYKLEISAEGYEDFSQEIVISRSFLNYVNNRTFTLKEAGEASIAGRLISPDAAYDFVNDVFEVGDKAFNIGLDGKFELTKLETGKQKVEFKSAAFKDLTWDLELKGGRNDLGDIQLTPTGDIVGSLASWLREDIVDNIEITVEGVPKEQIILDASAGEFVVKDLEVARKYKLRTQAAGYLTRDYEIGIDQGPNQIFEFRIVEDLKLPLVREIERNEQLVALELDGKNPVTLTQEQRDPPFGAELVQDVVYYFSTRDNIQNNIGGDGFSAYVTNLTGGNPQRLTSNVQNLGRQVPNFEAQKIANVRKGSTAQARILEVMDLAGNGRQTIKDIAQGQFGDIVISDDGKVIYFYIQSSDTQVAGVYRANIGTNPVRLFNKQNIQLLSVGPDGNRLLYSARNEATGLSDLYTYTNSTGQDTTAKSAITGGQYQFIEDSDTLAVFVDNRQGASNVYQLDVSTNTETLLTKFTDNVEGVEAIWQQGKLIIYQSNKGVYALDPKKPKHGKLITTDFERYTGYDF